MKVNKSLLILICLLSVFTGKTEIYPTFSIFELSFRADAVMEARFLKKE